MHLQQLGFDWWSAVAFGCVFGWLVLMGVASHLNEKHLAQKRHQQSLEIQRREHEQERKLARLASGTDDWGRYDWEDGE